MDRKGFFIELIVILIFLIIGFFWFISQFGIENEFIENQSSNNGSRKNGVEVSCVPAACCHSESCISVDNAPDCSDVVCSLDCKSGTMDCGQGECVYINGNCEVKWNE